MVWARAGTLARPGQGPAGPGPAGTGAWGGWGGGGLRDFLMICIDKYMKQGAGNGSARRLFHKGLETGLETGGLKQA